MRVLIVDVGGTHVKMLATGQREPREFSAGPTLTAEQMVDGVRTVVYDAVLIRYPGPMLHGRPVVEPRRLGGGNVCQLETLPPGCRAGDNAKRVRRLELGKVLAQRIIPELESRSKLALTHDSSTKALIRRYRMQKRGGR